MGLRFSRRRRAHQSGSTFHHAPVVGAALAQPGAGAVAVDVSVAVVVSVPELTFLCLCLFLMTAVCAATAADRSDAAVTAAACCAATSVWICPTSALASLASVCTGTSGAAGSVSSGGMDQDSGGGMNPVHAARALAARRRGAGGALRTGAAARGRDNES